MYKRSRMKKCISLCIVAIVLSSNIVAMFTNQAHTLAAEHGNLLSNPYLAVDAPDGQPQDYVKDTWGSHEAVFSVEQETPEAKFLRTQVSNYDDGDAKWYHAANSLDAGEYTYQDVYRSSVQTHYWVRYITAGGSVSYAWIGHADPSADWSTKSLDFHVAEAATNVSVFHVVNSNGYLDTRQFSLRPAVDAASCEPELESVITNGGFESTCSSTGGAIGWKLDRYGAITADYRLSTDAYAGSHSAELLVASAPAGEAGLTSAPVSVASNSKVNIRFRYKSSVYLYAYAEIHTDEGVSYAPLTSVAASTSEWSLYDSAFLTPAGASAFVLHIATSDLGQINIDDVTSESSELAGTAQFDRPLVSINFDDGAAGTYRRGVPLMNQYGFKGTYYLNGSTIDTPTYMTRAQVRALAATGNEIGSHGYTHTDLTTLAQDELAENIDENNIVLQALVSGGVHNFASPFGAFNATVVDAIMQRHTSHRDTSGALNHKYDFNPAHIHSKVITQQTTPAQIRVLLDEAKTQNAWLILTFHDISTARSSDEYTIRITELRSYLQLVKSSNVNVVTNQAAIQEIMSQL
ncbi:hypothetical protein E6P97_01350 [Patescibacteria group bacterium]|nr:MAG: hypothetical protein E6P97_01350 [Patescibacteria group bacterium]